MQEAQKRFEIAQKQYLRDQAAWRAAVVEVEEKAAAENAEAAAKVAAAQADLTTATQQRCFPWHALLYTAACCVTALTRRLITSLTSQDSSRTVTTVNTTSFAIICRY